MIGQNLKSQFVLLFGTDPTEFFKSYIDRGNYIGPKPLTSIIYNNTIQFILFASFKLYWEFSERYGQQTYQLIYKTMGASNKLPWVRPICPRYLRMALPQPQSPACGTVTWGLPLGA